MVEEYYPKEANLGKPCLYWQLGIFVAECGFPKYELQGRPTCGNTIDDVCLFVKDGRPITSPITRMLLEGIKNSPPNPALLPPGDIV